MKRDTKRRLGIFGAGLLIGSFISVLLFQYAAYVQGPRETRKVEVILTTCDLKPGDTFREQCVEKRVVAEQFVPPDVVMSDKLGLYVGEELHVALSKGDAIRTVDFQPPEPE